ncbi:hypothetical protein KO529_02350 [Arenibacter algicola]|uniref:hypothetical protein n=1 Tax=Arenibacter algicola TaxID=616991 RepID=UPI001C065977|nr:hypothetical protein [Arenibacter algicola]MBU2903614.1 hypothetical protein [Arenibacter algicola]
MTHSNSKNTHFSAATKKVILLTFVAFSFFNCKNKKEKTEETMKEAPMEPEMAITSTLQKGCYMYHENGSMVNLEITNSENPVEANLTYAYAEKDKNTGTFQGEFNDGKLVGSYTFQSEGIESTRQVAFMLEDNQFVEGYGELNEDGTMFKDVNSVNYSSTMPLTKMDCEE